jgi:Pvc16 N-terminal domain
VSNALGLAAVTQTIVNLLGSWISRDPELTDARVTASPPDKARDGLAGSQLNVFLYQATIDGAMRNMPDPRQVRPNETGYPPLPLDLHYLLTAYGRENRDDLGHRVLGRAMILLHDHPVLGASEIRAALADNDLWQQVERIRITPQPLSLDEMSKLWTTFQTQYRISVAYQVGVVLVDSSRSSTAPLPVLRRAPAALASTVPPFPTVEEVRIPQGRPTALLGDVLTLVGHDLAGDAVEVVFDSPRLDEPKRLPPEAGGGAASLSVTLPDDPAAVATWPPGLYTVAVQTSTTGPPARTVTSEGVPLRLGPVLTGPLPLSAAIAAGVATVSVRFEPEVTPEQRVSLLLGDREVPSPPRTVRTGTVAFTVTDAEAGTFPLRLRVDGVDSPLIDFGGTEPSFRADQAVELA